jgi:Lecithin:cholesterol acyltransferase
MLLDPYTQNDHPECKSRPDTGLSAITELDPGYITGNFFFRGFIMIRIVFSSKIKQSTVSFRYSLYKNCKAL